jgi:hypothetical protein
MKTIFQMLTRQRDQQYFKRLKDIHKGKRGFVICNGPSLRIEDLDYLKNEITIASNKIYLAFDQTAWRPTYFTIEDVVLWKKIGKILPKMFRGIHRVLYGKGSENTFFTGQRIIKGLGRCTIPFDGKYLFSNNLVKGVYTGFCITFVNLQFAVHLGLNPIYIIGCDHYYKEKKDYTSNVPIEVEEDVNHFIKGYRDKGEMVNPAPIDKMTEAFKNAKAFGDAAGIKIYNTTRGGHLEVFKRLNFEDLFDKSI